ncbi:MAG: diacylglycerol kinase family protein [Chitinophagaceae bacterium]
MSEKEKFSVKKRIRSFGYAFEGLVDFFIQEHNARIHLVAATGVILSGFYFHLSGRDWIALIFAMGLVISAEAFNSCMEKLADIISPDQDKRIKYIKDLSAGAVLVTALTAAIIGAIIFFPKLF